MHSLYLFLKKELVVTFNHISCVPYRSFPVYFHCHSQRLDVILKNDLQSWSSYYAHEIIHFRTNTEPQYRFRNSISIIQIRV